MTPEQTKTRLTEIGERLGEIAVEQAQSGKALAREQGTDRLSGIAIDPLTTWARKMRDLNIEVAELVEERKSLKETRRSLKPCCECDCH